MKTEQKWIHEYNIWFYALFGTAVGAGTLFLPIQLGLSGPLAMLVMLLIAFPFTYYPHLGLARYIITSNSPSPTLLSATKQYYGIRIARIINFFYALTFLLIIFVYAISITNSVNILLQQFWQIQFPRTLTAFMVVLGLHLIFLLGKKITLKFMGVLVLPLILYLLTLSVTLIFQWDSANIKHLISNIHTDLDSVRALWLLMPVMVFSFSHTPIMSTFSNHCKRAYTTDAEYHIKQIVKPTYALICIVILFFVFSCVLTLSPQEIQATKDNNITILSAIAQKEGLYWIAITATPVAIIAMTKSFLGTYFGALEGVRGLVGALESKILHHKENKVRDKLIGMAIVFVLTLMITIWNPNTLNVIAGITGPMIALILFVLPSLSTYLVEPLRPYRSFSNLIVLLVGLGSFGIAVFSLFS
ncbi:amino acid permease [Xenorhabdus bovienii]|uniref:amino acid permease n=1 Tax=Xenorhabdus bovienii TaxID=40576 RepID=UPI0021588EF7|nr:amino acid permease [Xenorhabdus bovienii]